MLTMVVFTLVSRYIHKEGSTWQDLTEALRVAGVHICLLPAPLPPAQAYKSVAGGPNPDLPVFGGKYTHDQMFFIAFGQVGPPLLWGYTSTCSPLKVLHDS